ncbi:MAG: hypothetical protein ABI140_19925 [Jatrophihabitantaceae bacterium]
MQAFIEDLTKFVRRTDPPALAQAAIAHPAGPATVIRNRPDLR